jgi:Na+-driven multidrug efflux pump
VTAKNVNTFSRKKSGMRMGFFLHFQNSPFSFSTFFYVCFVSALVMLKGDVLSGFFTTESAVIQNAYAYLKGFAPETLMTAVLFSMIGYFNGNDKTLWVMCQGLIQTLLVRLPMSYYMSIQPNASLTKIGLAAPVSTAVGIYTLSKILQSLDFWKNVYA